MAVQKIVAVTGANGYIAAWVVKLLLERGYTVRGTVRNPDDAVKVGPLLKLPGAKTRLTLHKANLQEEGAFDDIFVGVEGVFHIASPTMQGDYPDAENAIIIPAVKGTLNVLSAAAKVGTVKRVVFASSHAAVSISEAAQYPEDPNIVIDETWWSDPEWAKQRKMWYMLSKIQAEQAAWDFMKKEKNFDLVVLNPAVVLGPTVGDTPLNSSCEMILHFVDGTVKEYPYFTFGFVHVKDAALAHILVYETPSAQGRYCLVDSAMHASKLMDLLKVMCPTSPVPSKCVDSKKPVSGIFKGERIKKIGLVYTATEVVLREFLSYCREQKLLAF
ncbi:hypothetical protein R1sor_024210 [Riccia sorocarpa]|uniref:NAD-dependent epimerase/dehydratase domain-containing protein n=1 Tax=Riccia sorocarpa TaxID=122646 RepID=A0ABD3GS83_9MARC